MKTFELIARARDTELSKKYLDENGINQAMYCRDNIEDIIEELCDANNIAYKYLERIADITHKNFNLQLNQMRAHLKQMIKNNTINGQHLLNILNNEHYPKILRNENIIRIGIDKDIINNKKSPETEIINQYEEDKENAIGTGIGSRIGTENLMSEKGSKKIKIQLEKNNS